MIKTKVYIIGAGMAGLLAGNMLRNSPWDYEIIERQSSLPHNHSAVLRFRSSIVGDTLGIPFKKVTMVKDYQRNNNLVADSLSYALKVSGQIRSDRSILSCPKVEERFIAPPNLIELMAMDLSISYQKTIDDLTIFDKSIPKISTIPMPTLIQALNYDRKIEFEYRHGANIVVELPNCDAYVSLYVPSNQYNIRRISITGNEMIIEIDHDCERGNENIYVSTALNFLSLESIPSYTIKEVKHQEYSKILPINEDERKRFMFWATDKYGVFSLGRYATWRPGLLLDDLVKDVHRIMSWLRNDYGYDIQLSRS